MYIILLIAYIFVGFSQYLKICRWDENGVSGKSYYYFSFYGFVLFWPIILLIEIYKELKN